MGARTPYEQAADRAVGWLAARLEEDGSYGPGKDDLACYYKSPYLFQLSGRAREASRLLTFIQHRFMREDHDFVTSAGRKSDNGVFNTFWAYPNGWIAMAAQRMGRFDIAYPAFAYLRSFSQPDQGGFFAGQPRASAHDDPDALTTAHLGLLCLYFGNVERAEAAGRWLARLLAAQPDPARDFFLRLDSSGQVVRDIPEDLAGLYLVSMREPDQAYFMIGYPLAFLGKLFQATADKAHLQTARGYADIALACEGNLRSSHFSHKVAWGAAVLARITADPRCAELATAIADHLLRAQGPSGAWLTDQPAHTSFDQTAEIAIWLQEVSAELA